MRRPLRRFVAPPTLVALALVAVSLVAPSAASAALPEFVSVYPSDTGFGSPMTVVPNSLPRITSLYDVVFRRRGEPLGVALSGVSIADVLKANDKIDVSKVPFVKIRIGDTSSDAAIALVSLNGLRAETPPLLLDHGLRPAIGRWPTPAIVAGQPVGQPIHESQFRPLGSRDTRLAFIPAPAGARILSVRVSAKLKSSGEWLLTADVADAPAESLRFEWFESSGFGADQATKPLGTGKRMSTTSARVGRAKRTVSVVVTSASTGSVGTDSFVYVSRFGSDGALRDPAARRRRGR